MLTTISESYLQDGIMTLHNFQPLVYFISGLVMTCNFNSSLSFYSGILLMLIACLIWERRLENQ